MVYLEGTEITRHTRSFVPADVVLDPSQPGGLASDAREARHNLGRGDLDLEVPDLSRYDEFLGARP